MNVQHNVFLIIFSIRKIKQVIFEMSNSSFTCPSITTPFDRNTVFILLENVKYCLFGSAVSIL